MFISDDDKQLIARLNNGIDLCLTRQKPYFMPFMSERKQALLVSELKKAYFDNYLFFGGYDDSERKMLGLFLTNRVRVCSQYAALNFLSAENATDSLIVIFSVL